MKRNIRITAVGDIFLGEHPVTLGHGVYSVVKENGPEFLFENVSHLFRNCDIACGNLEGIISDKLKNEDRIHHKIFWGSPDCAKTLRQVGFNCLFLANNHTAQHGVDALKRTCNLLDRHNIQWTGFDPDNIGACRPARFVLNQTRISFLAYCETQQYHLDEPMLPLINLSRIKQDIQKERRHCDILLVSLHWGDEFIDYPSLEQITTARALIDQGAHVILGAHSHRIQGIEKYKGGLIAYSLGSFIKDLWPKKLRRSLILSLVIKNSKIIDYNVTPIWITKNHRPEVPTLKSARKFLTYFEKLSAKLSSFDLEDKARWQRRYKNDVKKLLLLDRISTIFYYLTHLHQYDQKLLSQNVRMMVKRRLHRRNI